jgi:hypothetical protein
VVFQQRNKLGVCEAKGASETEEDAEEYRSDFTGPCLLLGLDFWADRLRERGLDSEDDKGSEGRNGFRSSSRCWMESCLRRKAASSAAVRPLVAIVGDVVCTLQRIRLCSKR